MTANPANFPSDSSHHGKRSTKSLLEGIRSERTTDESATTVTRCRKYQREAEDKDPPSLHYCRQSQTHPYTLWIAAAVEKVQNLDGKNLLKYQDVGTGVAIHWKRWVPRESTNRMGCS